MTLTTDAVAGVPAPTDPAPRIEGVPLADLPAWVGHLGQVAGITRSTLDDGPARGTRLIQVVSGGGLTVDVHPDRALDLGRVTHRGVPLAWLSPTGFVAPAFHDASGVEWLRTFGGGLLATCGLDTFGPASEVAGEAFPLHGRVGTTPAVVTACGTDRTSLVVSGEVRQTRVFGENLLLRRRIEIPLGGASIHVHDSVTNEGTAEIPHMLLYHCNLGWPLLAPEAELTIGSSAVSPRDEESARGLADWSRIDPPTAGVAEQVFVHEVAGATPGRASLANRRLGLALDLTFDTATLPGLLQWKMMGEGHYVLGLEPNNCNWTAGLAAGLAAGAIPTLAPGQTRHYRLSFAVRDLARTPPGR